LNRTFSLVAEWATNTMPYRMPSVRRDFFCVIGFVTVRLRPVVCPPVRSSRRKLTGKARPGARRLEA
jgi:hypothetical protein